MCPGALRAQVSLLACTLPTALSHAGGGAPPLGGQRGEARGRTGCHQTQVTRLITITSERLALLVSDQGQGRGWWYLIPTVGQRAADRRWSGGGWAEREEEEEEEEFFQPPPHGPPFAKKN